jgi:hypothetical protein
MRDMGSSLGFLVVACAMTEVVVVRQPPAESAATVRQVHGSMIKPASDVIFNVGREAPRNPEAWTAIAGAGATLVTSGRLLTLALPSQDHSRWIRLSRELITAGQAARRTARARNLDALVRVSDRLVIVCETCHARYRKQGLGQTSQMSNADPDVAG